MRKTNLKTIFWIILISVISFSCSTPLKTQTIHIKSPFDPNEVNWFYKKGKNTITGQAFLRTRSGEVRTCAGYEVSLIPFSKYAEERMKAFYGNSQKGFFNIQNLFFKQIEFVPDSPEYLKTKKTTICDANGRFKFENLPDGEYFIVTRVIWEVPSYSGSYPVGGYLMQRVKLKGGETKEIILTN
ncbi:hypothetical protein [Persephonella sp. KM09-Lau-8]|uniref:hypothetical protein n=1 Tax=Persephonella sp. KM09-Lau-8 TaxID=1158345 RepID=UPI000569AF03|nr:hypothetical protein [Persephonella sp. KM09-Lau-8]